jgi:hypothetical protein
MATVMERPTKLVGERRFFFYISLVFFIVIAAGFSSDVFARHEWFTNFPWPVHVHAVVFSSWIILYVVQNWLVADGRNVMLHRRLGWLGAAIAFVMVPLGIAGTMFAIARGSIAGLFPLGLFLALDVLHILGFGTLTFAAIKLRNHAGWHKRLMLCGTALLTAPALGRLAATFSLGDLTPIVVITTVLLFILAGMAFDLAAVRRIHPAYWWGVATVALVEALVAPIGFSRPVVAFAAQLAG